MIEIALKHKFKEHPNYQLTSSLNQVFNIKTGREVRVVDNNGSFGVWFGRKFIACSKFRDLTIPISTIPNHNTNSSCQNLLNQLNKVL